MNIYPYVYIISVLISSFAPIFFKQFNDYFFVNMVISALALWVFGILIIILKSYQDKKYVLSEKLNNANIIGLCIIMLSSIYGGIHSNSV